MHSKYYTSTRHYPSLAAPRYSSLDMMYMFLALSAATMFFLVILMPFLPSPVLQVVAIAAGIAVTYLIRYSPRILRRARLAVVHRQIRIARNR